MEKTNLPSTRLTLFELLNLLFNYLVFKIRQIPFDIQIRTIKYGTIILLIYLFIIKDTNFAFSLGTNSSIAKSEVVSKGVKTSGGLFMNPEKLFGINVSKEKATNRTIECDKYIDRFEAVAQAEMKKYGIPASITLAQGLLESNMGKSKLASNNNNHFGIKCFSKACKKGHCSNFNDDHHKDFFRNFNTAWESYRSHSILLSGKRYQHLKKLDPQDYIGWAEGLQKAGYATDKRYAKKLIRLIETLGLKKYDLI